jgi:probable F420-dependent oxidoreductase
MALGKVAVWAFLDWPISFLENDRSGELGLATAPRLGSFARRIESIGYSHLWFPEGFGRNSLVTASWLLASTNSLTVATGIAAIHARDPMAMRGGADALNEQSGGRFVLGLGVSHREVVEGLRGQDYSRPLSTMRAYLDGYERAPYMAAPPAEPTPIVLAALGEKMLALAAARTQGAHTCNVTTDHTAHARSILGPNRWLCVEQPMILESDSAIARDIARRELGVYLDRENYLNAWRRMGFENEDFEHGGSDRFIDAIAVWGDEEALRMRIDEHLQAGASQVCIKAIAADGGTDMRILERLAPQQG